MSCKKTVLGVLVLAALTFLSLPAFASPLNIQVHDYGNYIDLGKDTQAIVLTGTGSSNSLNLDLGSCSSGGLASSSTCTMSGLAKGYGTLDHPTGAQYSITSPANLHFLDVNPSTGLWQVASNANAIKIEYGPGGSLLTGYINMLQFQQIPTAQSNGHNEYLATGNVAVTGGSLDHSSGWQIQFVVSSTPSTFGTLLGPAQTGNNMSFKYGEGPLYPTPEPASLALLGAGFLMVGGVMRFRNRRGVAVEI